MKKLLFILLLLPLLSKAQWHIPFYGNGTPVPPLTYPQIVTDKYLTLVSATNTEKGYVKKFVRGLEENDLYEDLLAFNICNWYISGRVYNLIIPLTDSGSFMITVKSGTVPGVTGAIEVSNGDTLDPHFINDLIDDEPFMGVFWVSNIGIQSQFISSASPFNIFPYDGGTVAIVNIWNNTLGTAVPTPPAGFSLAQRYNTDTVQFYQGITKFNTVSTINSGDPKNNKMYIIGGSSTYQLKIFGICRRLTEAKVIKLRQLINELLSDLGI